MVSLTEGSAAWAWEPLYGMWPRYADGEMRCLTAEEALAFFDPAQPPMVAARAAASEAAQRIVNGILAEERPWAAARREAIARRRGRR